ncbi:anti-sigma regulatory factor [Carbonactinospora thermoautotrophica]|uniref:Anti-sigma regulatory factor n=2 Tax=Carbonactinospora thermoautotrophica TaxID=1469144 RepID=A0A132MI93_9ACTN|nr:ATP-binding protein [Carbonactinospora thermoautotrophica]KWW97513.1 anti-sigma regulatory factor [Carbonactinospora thermoautotrophica]KWX07272.1 anti-sigma regulatory factor [Carbonactinospora thermoautotrophica]
MATVQLRFSALPSHVRTARLVAAALARRAGVDEAMLDEVRLAVGEACSRAVGLHIQNRPEEPVTVVLSTDGGRFSVEVADRVPADGMSPSGLGAQLPGTDGERDDVVMDSLPGAMGLAVISGLVEDVEVRPGVDGAVIRMSWPTAQPEC